MSDHFNMIPSAPAAGKTTATIWQRLRRFLLTQKGREIQVLIDLLVCSIYGPMREVYNQRYKTPTLGEAACRQPRGLRTISPTEDDGRATTVSPDRYWRDWPPLWPWLIRYRMTSSYWMVYVIIKNLFRNQLAPLIELVFRPSLPADCYLPGRFIIAEGVQRITASFFASVHLLWRYIQFKKYNRLDMSIVYFLLLDDRDISKYYCLLSHPAPSIQHYHNGQQRPWQPSEIARMRRLPLGSRLHPPGSPPVDLREQMMHDIMSYRVDYKEGQVFRLRPNRTPEACLRLRNTITNVNLLLWPLLFMNVCVIVPILCIIGFRIRRLLLDYPGCNPKLERAVKCGQVHERSSYFSEHVPRVLLWDVIENVILWFDSGAVCYIAPGFMFIFNHDLMIYWEHLHNKIDYVHEIVRDWNFGVFDSRGQVAGRSRSSDGHGHKLWLDELVFDLQMQIQDIIKQIKQADCFLTDATSTYLVVWFSMLAIFIYKSGTASAGSLPLPLLLPLLLMALVVTVIYASLLTLHRRIHRSYPLICSLMAHDRSRHKRNFISILDYFAFKRTCYTLFRLKSMTATSYLTIVGWSFSCYFLLSKV